MSELNNYILLLFIRSCENLWDDYNDYILGYYEIIQGRTLQ